MNVAKGKPSDYGADLLQRRFRLTTSLVNLEGKRILDFGCGNGAQTVTFTEMSAEITALDVHQPSLDQLSAYLRENEITDITPVQYDGSSIPFPDASFDTVISYEVLEHVQQESLALEEIARVLKAGGELIMSVPNKAWVFETHGANLPLLPWNRIPFFSWLPRRIHERWAKARIYRKSQIVRLIMSHGFEVYQAVYITAPMDVVTNPILKKLLKGIIFRNDKTSIPLLATAILICARKTS